MRRVLLVLLLLLTGCTEDPEQPRSTTTRYTYESVDRRGERTREVIDLQPPYRARTLAYRDDEPQGGFLWDESGTYTIDPDGAITKTAEIAPGFPGPATDLSLALPVALRQELVVRLGPGTAGTKPCTRWSSNGPLDSGRPWSTPSYEGTESCVDAAGTILSETWGSDTGLIRTRKLVSITKGPASLYDGRTPRPLPSALALRVVKPSTAAELAKLLGIPVPGSPPGMRPDQAKAVLDFNYHRSGFSREAGVMTWVGGGRLVVLRVERDIEPNPRPSFRGERLRFAALGNGYLEPVQAGLRYSLQGPRRLRLIVTADLPEAELRAWLATLRFS